MVSSPCESGLARNCGRKQGARGRRRGRLRAEPGWELKDRVGGQSEEHGGSQGLCPTGGRGPRALGRTRQMGAAHRDEGFPPKLFCYESGAGWAVGSPVNGGLAGAGPCHWDTAGGLDRAPRMGDDLNEDWKPEGWGFPAGGSHTSASEGPGLLRGPGCTHPTSGNG